MSTSNPMIEYILCATDGSDAATAAERFAIALAGRLTARLHGLTVIEDRWRHAFASNDAELQPPSSVALDAFLKARAERASRRFAERARAAGLDVACDVAEGRADDCIVARGDRADLIIVGRDGHSRAHRSELVGPTTDGVLRKARRSVLVVPDGAPDEGGLLLAFDGSTGSHAAARLAVELSSRLRVPAHLFIDSKDKGRSQARFDEVRALLADLPIPGRETSSTLGRPDVKIVEAAQTLGTALIVMGAFGRNRISDYFVGSNASAVVRTSPRAVLLAR